jgi:aminocyclitol acetyltransferase
MERVARTLLERAAGREIFIYGAGGGGAGEMMFRLLKAMGVDVSFFIDRKWHLFTDLCGLSVYGAEKLDCSKHFAVLSNTPDLRTVKSIQADLMMQGYSQGDWFHWDDDVDYDITLNGIVIGKKSFISDIFLKPNTEKLFASIGRYTSINQTLLIAPDHFYGLSTSRRVPNDEIRHQQLIVANRIEIGHDVHIGANVFVNQSRVKKIGIGAIIGSGTVVLEDVPPYSVVVGVPGKVKRFRFSPEQIEILQRVQWWNWDKQKMSANADCFVNPALFFERFGKNR